ncbi:fibronectin type III domain-containing protein [Prevotella sp.]|uniref:fibronectin type III domain-containing protein n=1 Tax=Prevotella sp. TaxID=59823 RepID=UPI0025E501A3|nr:fibronectin type III domain-containing protein [Prevotella sp.]
MKRFYASAFLLAAMTALPASAQNARMFPAFKAPVAPPVAAQSETPWHATSSIDDKSKGVVTYAGQTADPSKKRGWVKFPMKDAYNSMEKVYVYHPTDDQQILGMRCGAFDGEKYHALFTRIYTLTEYPDFYGTIDVKSGEVTDSTRVWRDWTNAAKNGEWQYQYEMAYNPADKQMYILGKGVDDENLATSILYSVQEDGSFEEIMKLDYVYFNVTFDYDGTMWGVRAKEGKDGTPSGTLLVKFNQDFEPEASMELLKEKSPLVQGTYGSMAFDYSTGDLYWYAVTSPNAYAYLFRVPTEMKKSCELEYMGGVATGTMLNGMYIPYLTADSREAAGRVTSIAAIPADDAVSKNTVSWTNPTLAWNRTELSDLAEVRVYRKKAGAKEANTTAELLAADHAELLATLPAAGKKGETMEWTDAAPLNGINTYYVVPCRVAGEIGMPDSVRCFSGNDAPAAPLEAKATKLGDQSIKVDWKAPNIGANNGYVNPASIKYIVTRQPDNVKVADTDQTTFTDNTVTGDDFYYYEVQAYTNEGGKGGVATTEKVRAGLGLDTPQKFNLFDENEANRWTVVDAGNSGANFSYTGPLDYQGYSLWTSSSRETNTWAFSPKLNLKKVKTYRFTYTVEDRYPKVEFSYYAAIATEPSKDKVVETIGTHECLYSETNYNKRTYTETFTPTEDGVYHFGLNVQTEDEDVFILHSVNVSEIFDNDITAVSLTTSSDAVTDYENKATVKVANIGRNKIEKNSYVVRVMLNTGDGLTQVGYNKWVPEIAAGDTVSVEMKYTPTLEGTFDIFATVEMEGDQELGNNQTNAVSVKCEASASTPWTNTVNGEGENVYTHAPFQCYGSEDLALMLYYPEEINANPGSKLMRIGFEYDANGYTETSEEQSIQIYMKNTKERECEDGVISTEGMTLVYDGTSYFLPGTNNIMSFDLDTPFDYDNTQSLCIVTRRSGTRPAMFGCLWHVFNSGGKVYRSMDYSENTPYDNKSTCWAWQEIPVLYMAFDKYVGIKDINVSEENNENAPVYNLNGQYVGNSTKLLKAGIYIQGGKKVVVK